MHRVVTLTLLGGALGACSTTSVKMLTGPASSSPSARATALTCTRSRHPTSSRPGRYSFAVLTCVQPSGMAFAWGAPREPEVWLRGRLLPVPFGAESSSRGVGGDWEPSLGEVAARQICAWA